MGSPGDAASRRANVVNRGNLRIQAEEMDDSVLETIGSNCGCLKPMRAEFLFLAIA